MKLDNIIQKLATFIVQCDKYIVCLVLKVIAHLYWILSHDFHLVLKNKFKSNPKTLTSENLKES